ncbi:unnamed protein product [Rotaria socialis]|uniref:Uncharacterized protein n=3 Tax=Rotaria socialis TaxID=392032 RepID=A0A818WDA5_9BILA|nr:unnamed protein product [Rotaria socialis]CAF3382776.1 unnamed protein product [Rotaria socialis]CAF3722571.1 unnamed protein product [Rotaria socialis]CAF4452123.1 unnamed protein product [Rotaria socialis]CAF4627892.1 unnamed protein product [Rotaria socialis]
MIEFKGRYGRISTRIGLALTGIIIMIVLGLIPLYIRKHRANSSQNGIAAYPAVLYIWSGQDISVSNAADFVAVIDFNESSSTYGQILKTVPLSSNASYKIKQSGNEPHHSAISSDGTYYISGGLLSFLSQQKQIFIWRVPQNVQDGPQFLYALDVPYGCPDELLAIGGAKFLLSMMCNNNGDSPGNVLLIDAATATVTSYLNNASTFVNFNPHGFARLNDSSLFLADYIRPVTLFGNDSSKILFRNTVRYFSADGSLERTFQFNFSNESRETSGVGQGIGFMDVKSIPNDSQKRAYSCGTNDNILYLIGPEIAEAQPVFDISEVNNYVKRISAGLISVSSDGTRLLMTFQMRFIILFNITQPNYPVILDVFDFCYDETLDSVPILNSDTNETSTFREYCANNNNITGSHVLLHPNGENRFIVMNYFLKAGLAQFAGTRSVHVFKLNEQLTNFTYEPRFNPNFQFNYTSQQQYLTFHSLKAYPHHVQYLQL